MAYREPKLQIFQDFEAAQAGGATPLYSCIVGPNYELHRFSETAEQAFISTYDELGPATVSGWPDAVAGGVVDLTTAEIMIENAKVRYLDSNAAGNLTVDNGNRFLASSLVFATNPASARSGVLGTRDVIVGDKVRATWIHPTTFLSTVSNTEVTALVANVVAGTTAPTNVRTAGVGNTTVGTTVDPATTEPAQFTMVYDATAYDGLVAGYPSDQYTFRVTAVGYGTTSGGTLDGTAIKITSAGGDTETDITLGASNWNGVEYDLVFGSRGATATVEDAGGNVLGLGETWRVTYSMTYTEVDVTAASEFDSIGPYTGSKNTQYIITCTSGGTVGVEDLTFSYSTNNGADSSGTITVPATDFPGAPPEQADYAIGALGITLRFFSPEQWNTGDGLVFDVTAQTEGPIQTLVLRDALDALAVTDIDLELFVEATFEFPTAYSTLTATTITISPNALYSTDLLGSVQNHAVIGGKLYADYRELRTVNSNVIGLIETIADAADLLGPAAIDNPLGKAVNMSLTNSGGVGVYYVPISTDDATGYASALDILTENDDVHGLVPLTNDAATKTLYAAHVIERSNEINNQWRMVWLTNNEPQIAPIYTELSGGADITATVLEFSPGVNTLVDVAGALFETNNVSAGDTLRINFATDAEGVVTYDEFVVNFVVDETSLVLLSGPTSEITVAVKIEIYRSLSNNQYATSLAQHAVRYNNRRISLIWADAPVEADGTAMDLYYVASALAGQRSGMAPHAPMSQVTLAGVSLDSKLGLSRTQLNTIASGGNWIVSKDFSGRVFTRHQVTSYNNPDDISQREQSKTTNLDHISRDFYVNTADLFGQGNVSPEMLALIRQRINSLIESISNRSYPAKIGPQMLGAEILRLKVDEALRDTIIVEIDPTMPDPLNTLTIHFTVS